MSYLAIGSSLMLAYYLLWSHSAFSSRTPMSLSYFISSVLIFYCVMDHQYAIAGILFSAIVVGLAPTWVFDFINCGAVMLISPTSSDTPTKWFIILPVVLALVLNVFKNPSPLLYLFMMLFLALNVPLNVLVVVVGAFLWISRVGWTASYVGVFFKEVFLLFYVLLAGLVLLWVDVKLFILMQVLYLLIYEVVILLTKEENKRGEV